MDLQSNTDININMISVPFMQLENSKLSYTEYDYYANQLSNILFNQDV